MPKHFIRVLENFTCNHCQKKVTGTGYTNHCPKCLYSKHVDNLVPGDRDCPCQGLMKPISAQVKAGKFILFHQCTKCQKITRCKAASLDNKDLLASLSTKPSPEIK